MDKKIKLIAFIIFSEIFFIIPFQSHGMRNSYEPKDAPDPECNTWKVKKAPLHFDADDNRYYFGNSLANAESSSLHSHYPPEIDSLKDGSIYKIKSSNEYYESSFIPDAAYRILGASAVGGIASLIYSGSDFYTGGFIGAVGGVAATFNPEPLLIRTGLSRNRTKETASKELLEPEEEENIETVQGQDKRIRVTAVDSRSFPYRVHGYVRAEVTDEHGDHFTTWSGSGTLIGDDCVLTAAHVLYSRKYERVPDRILFFPGRSDEKVPWSSEAKGFMFPKQYKTETDPSKIKEFDIGLIKLSKPLGKKLGYFGYRNISDKMNVNITGYPGELSRVMYTMEGNIETLESKRMSYTVQTSKGQSGAGVWTKFEESYECVAVHTNGIEKGSSHNSGTRITEDLIDLLEKWMGSKIFEGDSEKKSDSKKGCIIL